MFKKRIFALMLSCVLATTLLVGFAYASNDDYDYALGYPGSFNFALPAHGDAQWGDTVKKTMIGQAAFYVFGIQNPSGMFCYLNVRSSNGQTRVGTATQVAGGGDHYVSYRSGYGTQNTYYRPSAQTDADSAVSAHMHGTWRP